ncbi:hypothetical protein RFI_24251, partial [Reticulomyxa filosa]
MKNKIITNDMEYQPSCQRMAFHSSLQDSQLVVFLISESAKSLNWILAEEVSFFIFFICLFVSLLSGEDDTIELLRYSVSTKSKKEEDITFNTITSNNFISDLTQNIHQLAAQDKGNSYAQQLTSITISGQVALLTPTMRPTQSPTPKFEEGQSLSIGVIVVGAVALSVKLEKPPPLITLSETNKSLQLFYNQLLSKINKIKYMCLLSVVICVVVDNIVNIVNDVLLKRYDLEALKELIPPCVKHDLSFINPIFILSFSKENGQISNVFIVQFVTIISEDKTNTNTTSEIIIFLKINRLLPLEMQIMLELEPKGFEFR